MSTKANDVAYSIARHFFNTEGFPHPWLMLHEPDPSKDWPSRDGKFELFMMTDFAGVKVTVEGITANELGRAMRGASDEDDSRLDKLRRENANPEHEHPVATHALGPDGQIEPL